MTITNSMKSYANFPILEEIITVYYLQFQNLHFSINLNNGPLGQGPNGSVPRHLVICKSEA